MRIALLVFTLLISLHTTGCHSAPTTATSPYPIQFIDAQSSQPIQGVYVEATLTGSYFRKRSWPASGYNFAPLSDAAGKTILNLNSTPGVFHLLIITKPGYEAMTGQTDPEFHIWDLFYHANDELPAPVTVRKFSLPIEPGTQITIPMRRLGSDQALPLADDERRR